MVTTLCFGVSLGYMQAIMDPESAKDPWSVLAIYGKELDTSV